MHVCTYMSTGCISAVLAGMSYMYICILAVIHKIPMEQQTLQPEPESTNTLEAPLPLVQESFIQETQPEPENITSVSDINTKVINTIRGLGFDCDVDTFDLQRSLIQCDLELSTSVPPGSDPPSVRSFPRMSWTKKYSALSLLMIGQLLAEYERVSNMLGIPIVL